MSLIWLASPPGLETVHRSWSREPGRNGHDHGQDPWKAGRRGGKWGRRGWWRDL